MRRQRRRRRTGLWLSLAGTFGVGGLLFLAIFAVAAAVLGASFTGCQNGVEPAAASQAGPQPSAYALQSIPPGRLLLYERAGQRFNIDWSFLASIGTQECNSGTCAGDNGFGCAGPMQIAFKRGSPCSPGNEPTLWERYAVSAHSGQPPSINDPADAIYTAARILRQDKGTRRSAAPTPNITRQLVTTTAPAPTRPPPTPTRSWLAPSSTASPAAGRPQRRARRSLNP